MKRFVDLSEDDLTALESGRYGKQTKYNDASVEKLLGDYCNSKCITITSDKEQLCAILSSFISSVRTKTGEVYSSGGLSNIYHSIARVIIKKYDFDIRCDAIFEKLRRSLKSVKAISKQQGKGIVHHTEVISDDDLIKLGNLSVDSPVRLQWKTWFLMQLYFARRGNENGHDLKKEDVVFKLNAKGEEYIQMKDMMTKNHREVDTTAYGGIIMSTCEDDCPVKQIKLYLSKLHPSNEFFWQRPKGSYNEEDPFWFCNMKIGTNTYRKLMHDISKNVGLSQTYTNHSLRATALTILGRDFEDTDVASVSGHKSISALSIYKRTSFEKKMKMAESLNDVLQTGKPNGSVDLTCKRPNVVAEDAVEIVENNIGAVADSTLGSHPTSGNKNTESINVKETVENTVMNSGIVDADVSLHKDTNVCGGIKNVEETQTAVSLYGNNFTFSGENCSINITFNVKN